MGTRRSNCKPKHQRSTYVPITRHMPPTSIYEERAESVETSCIQVRTFFKNTTMTTFDRSIAVPRLADGQCRPIQVLLNFCPPSRFHSGHVAVLDPGFSRLLLDPTVGKRPVPNAHRDRSRRQGREGCQPGRWAVTASSNSSMSESGVCIHVTLKG